jgi:hypothetical protein
VGEASKIDDVGAATSDAGAPPFPLRHLALSCALRGWSGRDWMEAPFSLDVEGERWACATDGHQLAARRGVDAAQVENIDKVIGHVRDFFTVARGGPEVDASALRAWAGEPVPRPTCKECDGAKQVEAHCDSCPHSHVHDCHVCDGIGSVAPPQRHVRVLGAPVNQDILARALAAADAGGMARWAFIDPKREDVHAGIALMGGGWFVAVMGTRSSDYGKPTPIPSWPESARGAA